VIGSLLGKYSAIHQKGVNWQDIIILCWSNLGPRVMITYVWLAKYMTNDYDKIVWLAQRLVSDGKGPTILIKIV
jgi:hypothetical protein